MQLSLSHTSFIMEENNERQKLEFMAAVKLVPPAVLEEIHRRQMVCRAELGNWWERQHSKDFCLVPRDPVNQVTQATWVTLDNRVNEDPNNLTTGEPVETVEINEVPTPDYAIEIPSTQDYYNSNVAINQLKLQQNGLQFFMTSSLP